MHQLRAAVIGVGYLGNFHAQKYAHNPAVELVAVVDTDAARGAEIGAKYECPALTDYHELFGLVDLVSIVVPPAKHFALARDCLEAGVHTLVEKPLTERVDEAETLIRIADEKGLILQVGHLERFNPGLAALTKHINQPSAIEAERFAVYKARGTEVDVVLDLMIHDIDIVLSLIPEAVKSIQASGTAVMSGDIDIAHARIEFTHGLVAELSASRVSQQPSRVMKVIEGQRFAAIDYAQHELKLGRIDNGSEQADRTEVIFETQSIVGTDVLAAEIEAFIAAVRSGSVPRVTGEDGKRALALAIDISRRINRYRAETTPAADLP